MDLDGTTPSYHTRKWLCRKAFRHRPLDEVVSM